MHYRKDVPMDWQQYEDYMLRYVQSYTITEFLGRAKYNTFHYDTIVSCANAYRNIRKESPNRRILVYAVCQPPNRRLSVSLPIAEAKLP